MTRTVTLIRETRVTIPATVKMLVTVKIRILTTRAGLVTRTGASLGQGSLFEL